MLLRNDLRVICKNDILKGAVILNSIICEIVLETILILIFFVIPVGSAIADLMTDDKCKEKQDSCTDMKCKLRRHCSKYYDGLTLEKIEELEKKLAERQKELKHGDR